MSHTPQSPVNPLPMAVVLLVGVMAVVEAAFTLGTRGIAGGPEAIGWRLEAIQNHAFIPQAFWWMLETATLRVDYLTRLVTYPFIHVTFTQMLFAAVMTLALGKFVGERLSGWAVALVFFVSCILGAAVYALLVPEGPPLIGAFPGVYGLIGAFTCLLWLYLGAAGQQQIRAFTLIGLLLALQLVFGVLFGGGPSWIADVSGFAAGFFLSFVLVPGGWARLRAKLRHE